jgi:hypothetical protein
LGFFRCLLGAVWSSVFCESSVEPELVSCWVVVGVDVAVSPAGFLDGVAPFTSGGVRLGSLGVGVEVVGLGGFDMPRSCCARAPRETAMANAVRAMNFK